MAERISDLPATGAAVATDEYEINQGGISKKVTTTQLNTYFHDNVFDQTLDTTDTVEFVSVVTPDVFFNGATMNVALSSGEGFTLTSGTGLLTTTDVYLNDIYSQAATTITLNNDVVCTNDLTVTGTVFTSDIDTAAPAILTIGANNASRIELEETVRVEASKTLEVSFIDTAFASSMDLGPNNANDINVYPPLLLNNTIELVNETTAQRTGRTPSSGEMVFDSDLNQFFGYNGSAWVILG